MPTWYCSKCDDVVKAPRPSEGRKARCPNCRASLKPADELPNKLAKKDREQSAGYSKLVAGIAVAGGVFVLGTLVILVQVFVLPRRPVKDLPPPPPIPFFAAKEEGPRVDLKSAIIGTWILTHSIELKTERGKQSYIKFAERNFWRSDSIQGGYTWTDRDEIELTYEAKLGVPPDVKSKVIVQIEDGKARILKRGFTMAYEKFKVTLDEKGILSLCPRSRHRSEDKYVRDPDEKKEAK